MLVRYSLNRRASEVGQKNDPRDAVWFGHNG